MRLKQVNVPKAVFTLSTLSVSCLLALNSYAAVNCDGLDDWQSSAVYTGGAQVQHNHVAYQAKYWTQNNNPAQFSGDYAPWQLLGSCDTGNGGEDGDTGGG